MNGNLRWFAIFLVLMLILPSFSSLAVPDKAQANGGYPANVYVDGRMLNDSGDGLTWATAKKYIQSGIALTNPAGGGTINVWAGTYQLDDDVDNYVLIDHPLNLVGAGSGTTTIDGYHLSHYAVVDIEFNIPEAVDDINETGTVNISGFTIRNGYRWGGVWIHEDNGVINMNDCTIADNYINNNNNGSGYGGGLGISDRSWGGGIAIEPNNTVTMISCNITGNLAGSSFFAPNPTGENNTAPLGDVDYYYYGSAGGIFIEDSSLTMNNCGLQDNHAQSESDWGGFGLDVSGSGGGMVAIDGSIVDMTGCTVSGNSASGTGVDVSGSGGGIVAMQSTLTMTGCTVSHNSASGGGLRQQETAGQEEEGDIFVNVSGSGGGIATVESTLTMTTCIIEENSAISASEDSPNEGVIADSPTSMACGGGIASVHSNVTLSNCPINNNNADAFGGGIVAVGIDAVDSTTSQKLAARDAGQQSRLDIVDNLTITGCNITGNSAGFWGGGVLDLITPLYVSRCNISNNSADRAGGGIFLIASISGLNISAIESLGSLSGGDDLPGGLPEMQGSLKNGALMNEGDPVLSISNISDSTIANNSSGNWGGGLATVLSLLEVDRCTFNGNATGRLGGGIGSLLAESLIINSTIYGNSLTGGTFSPETGGAPGQSTIPLDPISDAGGGIGLVIGYIGLLNDTIANNSTSTDPDSYGGGIFTSRNTEGEFENTLVANNFAPRPNSSDGYSRGYIYSYGHNISSDNSCGFADPTDQVNTNPLLGPLVDNGGPTRTCAVGADSPAFNHGDNSDAPLTDQRGVARPQAAFCTIGAYETTLNKSATTAVATGEGNATFTTDIGGITDLRKYSQLDCLGGQGLAGGTFTFPFGFFSFKIVGLVPGAKATITITLPSPIPPGAYYYKCINGQSVDCTSLLGHNDGGNILTLTITDGGLGDADGAANGTIIDPGGPATIMTLPPASHSSSTATPPSAPILLPNLVVQNASLSAYKVSSGSDVTISAAVANHGTVNGTTVVKLYINGQEEAVRSVNVESGKTVPLSFTVSRSQPGSYSVYVGGTSAGSFVVEDVSEPNIILFISAGFILLALVLGIIYIRGRRQYS